MQSVMKAAFLVLAGLALAPATVAADLTVTVSDSSGKPVKDAA